MNPLLMFILAILSPFLMAITLLAPPYAGIAAASYVIYNKGDVNPLHDKLTDVFYIIEVYSRLFSEWAGHMTQMDLVGYTLPLLMLPIAGIMFALWVTGKLAVKLKNVFHGGMTY